MDGFCNLVFRDGRLTIGAPTSPAVSNALCFDLDAALHGLSFGHGVMYTRYADDLFFSSTKKDVLYGVEREAIEQINRLDLPRNLRLTKQDEAQFEAKDPQGDWNSLGK